MSLLSLLITLILVCLGVAITWWAISKFPLPPPAQWVVAAVLAIVMLLVLFAFLPVGGVRLWR